MNISVSYLCRFYLASMEWTNLFVVKKKKKMIHLLHLVELEELNKIWVTEQVL